MSSFLKLQTGSYLLLQGGGRLILAGGLAGIDLAGPNYAEVDVVRGEVALVEPVVGTPHVPRWNDELLTGFNGTPVTAFDGTPLASFRVITSEPEGPNEVTTETPRADATLDSPLVGRATVPQWNDEKLLAFNGTPVTTFDGAQIVAFPP